MMSGVGKYTSNAEPAVRSFAIASSWVVNVVTSTVTPYFSPNAFVTSGLMYSG
jgi:hypothetical protein